MGIPNDENEVRLHNMINDFIDDANIGKFTQPPRSCVWADSIAKIHQGWKIAKEKSRNEYDHWMRSNGIKDNINNVWVTKYKEWGNKEQKEMIDDLERRNFHRLFNPFLKLKGMPA